ncbi:MAG: hypothetical protein QGI63_09070 [Rhodospirillales bacterium]|jgi:hypothetical protein|nr:hypothetical protein [Rhodospirillales bacterium]MDP6774409.1 hypothetical protein [Rhodospirillales bacterium]
MTTIDWSGYVSEQFRWAQRLMAIAEEAQGEESRELRLKAEATLIDASHKLGVVLAPIDTNH